MIIHQIDWVCESTPYYETLKVPFGMTSHIDFYNHQKVVWGTYLKTMNLHKDTSYICFQTLNILWFLNDDDE